MTYETPSNDYTDSRMQFSADQNQFEPHTARPRASSNAGGDRNMSTVPRFVHPNQPLDEAVTNAVSSADAAHYVPPEIIAQITADVINQLKTTGINSATPMPTTQPHFSPPPQPPPLNPQVHQPVPQSPLSVSASPSPIFSRNVYTPPSLHKNAETSGHGSPPPHSAFAQPLPTNPPSNVQSYDRRPSSPLSQASESSCTRPKGPTRLSTSKEETILEKIWGQLFDEDGHPTPRLGQFLRGLAVHIIEDYEPCFSIVITPEKMLKYYEDVKLPSELYPWSTIFDEEQCKISRMYRQLSCQHHLVQEHDDQRPDIPGLTPVGFERWVTQLIKAHPEEEYQRLQKTVLDMPISNPDEKERFPKEISRRLFPGSGDREAREFLETAISEYGEVKLPRRGDSENSPSHRHSVGAESTPTPIAQTSVASEYVLPNHQQTPNIESTSRTPLVGSSIERQRAPYSNTPSEAIIDDTNPPPPPSSQPLERERKPYSAVPGGGKQWEDEVRAGKPRSESIASKSGHSSSTAQPRNTPGHLSGSNEHRSAEIPKPEIHQHHRANSTAHRHRSPSFSRTNNDFRRSDGDFRGYQSYQGSSISSADTFEDNPRRHPRDQADRARRQADDDMRAYGQSPSNRGRYEREVDYNGPHRSAYVHEDDYYRTGGRGGGNGYDHSQPYGGPVYR